MGSDEPLVTFNHIQSKIIYAQQNNIFSLNLKQVNHETKDGEIINIPPKQLGSSELFPNKIQYIHYGPDLNNVIYSLIQYNDNNRILMCYDVQMSIDKINKKEYSQLL